MGIIISDPQLVARIQQLADKLNQTPEQVVANAIDYCWPKPRDNRNAFWEKIRGIGDSDDPNLAYRIKDILCEEVDPIEGWG